MQIKDLKFGDIATFENSLADYICIGNGVFQNLWASIPMSAEKDLKSTEITKVQRYVMHGVTEMYKLETIYERKEILDGKEKEYLRGVIKPFRDKIRYIRKDDAFGYEWLVINHSIAITTDNMVFPTFKKGTMYKNMELDKEYSLKELDL